MTALLDVFKKKKEKPAAKPKAKQAGPPESKKVLAGKPAPKKKDLREVYKILKEPHISEKSTQLADERKYTFKVYTQANKVQIKNAISNLYGVKVEDVNIINIKPKKRILRGMEGRKTGYKKAVVTLKEGEKIEILPH